MACKYLKHPCLHPPQSYVWKKEIICCAAICLFLINTPILLPWRAPASPLFLPPSLSMHILLYDYLNGCQKNTVTRLIWAVRAQRGERGALRFSTLPFTERGSGGWERNCCHGYLLAASVLVFGEHWLFPLYPNPGREERGRRWGGTEVMGVRRWGGGCLWWGGGVGVQLPKGEQHKVSSKSEGCWLEKEQQKSNTEGSGGWSAPASYIHTHQCWWQGWQQWGDVEEWQWTTASVLPYNVGVSTALWWG